MWAAYRPPASPGAQPGGSGASGGRSSCLTARTVAATWSSCRWARWLHRRGSAPYGPIDLGPFGAIVGRDEESPGSPPFREGYRDFCDCMGAACAGTLW